MKADFGGYATRNDLLCADGRTITRDAFKHQDKVKLPLVWDHKPKEKDNILGHVILENREDGVYVHGSFNNTEEGKRAKELVQHGDIEALSIWANELVEQGKRVTHGMIREVSLVWAGANPGALIDNVYIRHSDGTSDTVDGEAIIYTGYTIQHGLLDGEMLEDDDEDEEETVLDVWNTLTTKQKNLFDAMLGNLMEDVEPEDQGTELVMNHYNDDSGDTFDIVDAHLMLHYGVKGMKWGKRKKRDKGDGRSGGGSTSSYTVKPEAGGGRYVTEDEKNDPYSLPGNAKEGTVRFVKTKDGDVPVFKTKDGWDMSATIDPKKAKARGVEIIRDGREYEMTSKDPVGSVKLARVGVKGDNLEFPMTKFPDGSWKVAPHHKVLADTMFKKAKEKEEARKKAERDQKKEQNRKDFGNDVDRKVQGAKNWVKDQIGKVVVSQPTQRRGGMFNTKTGKYEWDEWKTDPK